MAHLKARLAELDKQHTTLVKQNDLRGAYTVAQEIFKVLSQIR